jgi:hypothetical protein
MTPHTTQKNTMITRKPSLTAIFLQDESASRIASERSEQIFWRCDRQARDSGDIDPHHRTAPGDLTAYADTEYWWVTWVEVRNGKTVELTQTHYTERAARRHLSGLMAQSFDGMSVKDVYGERP